MPPAGSPQDHLRSCVLTLSSVVEPHFLLAPQKRAKDGALATKPKCGFKTASNHLLVGTLPAATAQVGESPGPTESFSELAKKQPQLHEGCWHTTFEPGTAPLESFKDGPLEEQTGEWTGREPTLADLPIRSCPPPG
jgi:hypothetical protein